jgi:AGZA family xanthine/uracil permease-like MFS transporter
MNFLNKFFKLAENKTTIRVEVLAGITTFMTMSYIIFLQPLILSGNLFKHPTGMDYPALLTGGCLAAMIGSILMGIIANYPVALAPGMGENFFFLTVVGACVSLKIAPSETAWQTALAVVLVSGILFMILSFLNIRQLLMDSISMSMKSSMAVGIGLFIALIGLLNSGLISSQNGHYMLNAEGLNSASTLIFFVGLILTAVLHTLRIRGAIIWGILAGIIIALCFGKIHFSGILSMPASVTPILGKIDMGNLLKNIVPLLPFIIIFTIMDVFDTLGTLVGVSAQANLMKDGKLPRVKKAFAADSISTVVGVFFGQSTVTSYIESTTGVEQGGRTGLTAVVTGLCFFLALFFAPIIMLVGSYPGGINPITAPALVVVGAMMMKNIKDIEWDDFSEAIPAFLIVAGIAFTFSIADGLTLGFIAYPLIKVLSKKGKEIGWLTYLISGILLIYLIIVKTGLLAKWLG